MTKNRKTSLKLTTITTEYQKSGSKMTAPINYILAQNFVN